jgi:hypothetical protein
LDHAGAVDLAVLLAGGRLGYLRLPVSTAS